MEAHPDDTRQPGPLMRTAALLLRPFAEVKPFEVAGVLVLMATGFILMTAYYLLKVTREPLVLAAAGGAEIKSFASAGQATLLLLFTTAYRALADRMTRRRLTLSVYSFFALVIGAFTLADRAGLAIGVPFFLFVGIFNLSVLSQFWSVANDLYTDEAGKRVFALFGLGTALGAIFGAFVAGKLFETFQTTGPLVASIALLLLGLGGVLLAETQIEGGASSTDADSKAIGESAAGKAPLDKYLIWLAVLVLALNAFNALGEYILDRVLTASVIEKVGTETGPAAKAEFATFKSTYYLAFNTLTLLLQLFVSSRAIRWLGPKNAIFILPLVGMAGFGTAAFMPVLTVILIVKVMENAVDYSVQNTTWQSLFLVLTRREKYVAKNTIDTVFVRLGDVVAASLVGIGSKLLKLPTVAFILANLGVGTIWLIAAWCLRLEYPKKAQKTHEREQTLATAERQPA